MTAGAGAIAGEQGGVDLGSDVRAVWVSFSATEFPRAPRPAGVLLYHPRRDAPSERCSAAAYWWRSDDRPTWQLVSLAPLTIEPSVLCRLCNWHGHVRGGRWVTA